MTMKTSEQPASQKAKFEDLARELEADEDPAHFEETLKKVATPRNKRPEPLSKD